MNILKVKGARMGKEIFRDNIFLSGKKEKMDFAANTVLYFL